MDVVGGPTLSTFLGDAAPALDGKTLAHFYVGVLEIDAIANGQSVKLGSSAAPYQMDLLAYQNGSADWMTQTSVPKQTYSQLRYVVDLSSTQAVFADGSSMPVQISTAATRSLSGMGASTVTAADTAYANAVDITIAAPFTVDSTSSVNADFNLSESLTENQNSILMRPTLSAATGAGQISGTVVNASGQAVQGATVVAFGSNGAAVNSATTDANGAFGIHALGADTYQLRIYNTYTNAAGYASTASGHSSITQTVDGPSISLTSGATVSAGTISD
jgi:hypothetical protein